MSVRTKLVLSMAVIAGVLVIPAVYGLSQLHEVRTIANSLEGKHAAAQVSLGELQDVLNRADRLGRRYVALGEPATRKRLETTLRSADGPIARLRDVGYDSGARRLSARMRSVVEDAENLYEAVEDGEIERATAYFDQFTSSLVSVREATRSVAAWIDERSTAAAARAGRVARRATLITAIGIAAGFVLVVGLGLAITRDITVPLGRLTAATEDVAEGRFEGTTIWTWGGRTSWGR